MPEHNWTMAEYLACSAMSSGIVHRLMSESPLHVDKAPVEENDAMRFGSLQHMAVTEPHKLALSYAIWQTTYRGGELVGGRPSKRDPSKVVGGTVKQAGDKRPRSGTLYDAFEADALRRGLVVCTDDDMAEAGEIGARVRNHYDLPMRQVNGVYVPGRRGAGPIITHPQARYEVSRTFTHEATGLLCKMRSDVETPELTADIKCWTRRQMRPRLLWKQAYNLGYHVKAAWYKDGRKLSGGADVPFVLIFVQVVPPYEIAVLDCPEAGYLELGRQAYEAGLYRYAECRRTGYWPGCMDGHTTMVLPPYADIDDEDATFDIEEDAA